FMDKLVDHLFILEGDAKIRDFNGTYSEYRELKRLEDKEKPKEEQTPILETEDPLANLNKATYEQRKDFARLEKEIKKLEEKKNEITLKFDDAALSSENIMDLSLKLDEIISQISEKEEKWFELAELM
ncbi:MAG: ABC transporter ATP-binding protein, partial [Saprospiraceae bacterium]|nr:ABC transporter ATP-binding protein [Saprospiraceae bacterium]